MSARLPKISSATCGAATLCFATWAAVGAAALFTVNAHADDVIPQLTVKYADLDLSKPADAKALYSRLEAASKVVCRALESREVSRRQQHQACYEQALSDAVAFVDHAGVTALYRSEGNMRIAQRNAGSQRRT